MFANSPAAPLPNAMACRRRSPSAAQGGRSARLRFRVILKVHHTAGRVAVLCILALWSACVWRFGFGVAGHSLCFTCRTCYPAGTAFFSEDSRRHSSSFSLGEGDGLRAKDLFRRVNGGSSTDACSLSLASALFASCPAFSEDAATSRDEVKTNAEIPPQSALETLKAEAAAAGVSLQVVWSLLNLRNAPFFFHPTEVDVPVSPKGRMRLLDALPPSSQTADAKSRTPQVESSSGEETSLPALQDTSLSRFFPSDVQTLRMHSLLEEPVCNAAPNLRRRKAARKERRLQYLSMRRTIAARTALRMRFTCTFFAGKKDPFEIYDPWVDAVEKKRRDRERVALQALKLRRMKRWWIPRRTIKDRIARRRALAEALKKEEKKRLRSEEKSEERQATQTQEGSEDQLGLNRSQREEIVRRRLRYQQELLWGRSSADPRSLEEKKAEDFYVKKSVDLAEADEQLFKECVKMDSFSSLFFSDPTSLHFLPAYSCLCMSVYKFQNEVGEPASHRSRRSH